MQAKPLGNSDLEITPVGFGAWAIGGSGWEFGWGSQADQDSIRAIHRALDIGVNWIDTAAAYGLGHSEKIVAEAIKQRSGERPYVFTKCAVKWDKTGKTHRTISAESFRQECEDSLRRLQIDAIDLYQIHWPTGRMEDIDDGWAELARLQEEGKLRWIGVSNFDVAQMKRAENIAPVTSLQPPYSLIRRGIEDEILPYCKKQNIGVIVYSPMASGLLTGAMTRTRAENLPSDDWRRENPNFREPKLSDNLALVDRLRAVGERYGRSPGEVAIAWTLRHPAVTAAIVGARNEQQIDGVFHAADLQLSEADIAEIEELAPS